MLCAQKIQKRNKLKESNQLLKKSYYEQTYFHSLWFKAMS